MCKYAICLNALTDHLEGTSNMSDSTILMLLTPSYLMLTAREQEDLLQALQTLNAEYLILSLNNTLK